jgi:hypothetical protein
VIGKGLEGPDDVWTEKGVEGRADEWTEKGVEGRADEWTEKGGMMSGWEGFGRAG